MTEDKKLECQPVEENFNYATQVKRNGILSALCLYEENLRYADSLGVSIHNRDQGFLPAFKNTRSGSYVPSRFADGRPAPIHVLDGLPDEWIAGRARNGQATRTFPQIISGFIRNGKFYTRDEATNIILNRDDDLI